MHLLIVVDSNGEDGIVCGDMQQSVSVNRNYTAKMKHFTKYLSSFSALSYYTLNKKKTNLQVIFQQDIGDFFKLKKTLILAYFCYN